MNTHEIIVTTLIFSFIYLYSASGDASNHDECVCSSEDYHHEAIKKGFVRIILDDRLQKDPPPIRICMWRRQENDDGGRVIWERASKIPSFGHYIQEKGGFEFDLEEDWDIRGVQHLVARPRLNNYEFGQDYDFDLNDIPLDDIKETLNEKLMAINKCPVDLQVCSVFFEYSLKKAWDVQVTPIAHQNELTVELGDKQTSAGHIAPYESCPESYLPWSYHAEAEESFVYQVKKHRTLKLKVGRYIRKKYTEDNFTPDLPKKVIDILSELEKYSSRDTPATRQVIVKSGVKRQSKDGKSEEERTNTNGPIVVIERLFGR